MDFKFRIFRKQILHIVVLGIRGFLFSVFNFFFIMSAFTL